MALSSDSRLLTAKPVRAHLFDSVVCRLRSRRLHRVLLWIAVAITSTALTVGELRSSWLQSRLFGALASRMSCILAAGPHRTFHNAKLGPYDERLGYSRIADFVARAEARGYSVEAQARPSSLLLALADSGAYPIYREKSQTGLQILDQHSTLLYSFPYPQHAYHEYSEIPQRVVDALLFIENRDMLDIRHPNRNPAIEWTRLSRAVVDYGIHVIHSHHQVIGGSTLATQLEKMRHSPGGRTHSASDKARQMLSASLRAYQDGPDTLGAQQRIIRDYLNSLPLGAVPGQGEVVGLGEGLVMWYGADFDKVNQALRAAPKSHDIAQQQERARAYRQVLSLLLATRAPFRYLLHEPDTLRKQTDRYLRVLCSEGLISTELRDLALRNPPLLAPVHPDVAPDFVENKARDMVRGRLLSLLGIDKTYGLDRLDLEVGTTIDATAQEDVTKALRGLTNPAQVAGTNLREHRLLAESDPRAVIYSFILYQRAPGMNLLRIQADNYNQPLSIVDGTKLELGSTAKLRTLVTYLQVVEQLHRQYAQASVQELSSAAGAHADPLTAWAIQYLLTAHDQGLVPMLQAALDRCYSASPGEGFFTASGLHFFRNFESSDDHRTLPVREAFERSVNLVFIRLMRDIERFYISRGLHGSPAVTTEGDAPARRAYLNRFADQEGRVFLLRFYRKYAGLSPDQSMNRLVDSMHVTPVRVSVAYRSIRPNARLDEFATFVKERVPSGLLQHEGTPELYEKYGSDKFSLADRGYLARVHPLELWLLAYLAQHPQATFAEAVQASADERQRTYSWLFRTRHQGAQDRRIRIVIEQDAFNEIWRAWRKLGYPFDKLVPSYATAIGVSGDTPAALAELMGIVINDGILYPNVTIRELHFGTGTPFESILRRQPASGERVLSPEIAALVRQELIEVVEKGSARRAQGGIKLADEQTLPLGGKTGTGDNRIKIFSPGRRLVESRVANRTATFVFMIGDQFYGAITIFVSGKAAAGYEFTSSLAVQVFKDLEPVLRPLIERQD